MEFLVIVVVVVAVLVNLLADSDSKSSTRRLAKQSNAKQIKSKATRCHM